MEDKKRKLDRSSEAPANDGGNDHFTLLLNHYIIADRFGVRDLRVAVINHLQNERDCRKEIPRVENLPSFEDVSRAFDNLRTTSPLRA